MVIMKNEKQEGDKYTCGEECRSTESEITSS
jgi:hypothetical protein